MERERETMTREKGVVEEETEIRKGGCGKDEEEEEEKGVTAGGQALHNMCCWLQVDGTSGRKFGKKKANTPPFLLQAISWLVFKFSMVTTRCPMNR